MKSLGWTYSNLCALGAPQKICLLSVVCQDGTNPVAAWLLRATQLRAWVSGSLSRLFGSVKVSSASPWGSIDCDVVCFCVLLSGGHCYVATTNLPFYQCLTLGVSNNGLCSGAYLAGSSFLLCIFSHTLTFNLPVFLFSLSLSLSGLDLRSV